MKLLNQTLLQETLDKRAELDIANGVISGYAVCVMQDNKPVYTGYYGMAQPEKNIPIKEDSLYWIASMTKPVTTAAALWLIDHGMLSLSDPVAKYFPEYGEMYIGSVDETGNLVRGERAKETITVLHLLTHTSGIGCGTLEPIHYRDMTAYDCATIQSTTAYFAKRDLDFEPFTAQAYSAVAAFEILAAIIEKITGESYWDFLKKAILDPCGMTDTVFEPTEEQWDRVVTMHDRVDGKSVISPLKKGWLFDVYPCSHHLGCGGLATTIGDYTKFAQMLLNHGRCGDKQVLSPEVVAMMSTPQVPASIMEGSERWGLGVRVVVGEDTPPVGTFGWAGAYGTYYWVDPANRITAVYMKNSKYDGGISITGKNFEKDVYASLG